MSCSYLCNIPIPVQQFTVFVSPRETGPVERVLVAGSSDLISIVDARDARKAHLYKRCNLEAFDAKSQLFTAHMGLCLNIAGRIGPQILSGKSGQDSDAVMSAQDIHKAVYNFRRIVFGYCLNCLRQLFRIAFSDEVYYSCAERVVHYRIQTIAFKIVLSFVIGDLVGCVLPNLADYESIAFFGLCSADESVEEIVRKLVSHIEPPA